MRSVLRKITLVYYLIYVAAIIAASSGFAILKAGINIDPTTDIGIAINSFLIIFIIGSVPLSLWIFNTKTKKWAKLENEDEKLEKYQKAAILRLFVLGLGLVLGVLFYYILGLQSMIFSAGIAAVGVFFCKPSEAKIRTELELDKFE
jgi:hypothetical protein